MSWKISSQSAGGKADFINNSLSGPNNSCCKYPSGPKEIFWKLKFLDTSQWDSEIPPFESEADIKENIKQTGLRSWKRCDCETDVTESHKRNLEYKF